MLKFNIKVNTSNSAYVNLNTSHVKVQLGKKCIVILKKYYLNTSHVKVQHTDTCPFKKSTSFKYISC